MRQAKPQEIIFKANQVLHQLIFDLVEKVNLGGHLYPLINKAKKIKASFILGKYSLNFSILLRFIYTWINKTLKLDWCNTCRMLIVGVISWCKGSFMPCILPSNTLKLYTQKHHKYIIYSIFNDFIEIYSFTTNNFLFIMLKKYFRIVPTRLPKYIQNIKTDIECFSCWSRTTTMWGQVFY